MNWTAVGAVGQLAAAVAVFATLLYLARQVRQSNRQDLLSAFQHTYDSINEWGVAIFESSDVSSIVIRGRESYKALSETERLRFDHVHLVLLNVIESHYYQVQKTAMDESYRGWAMQNLAALIRGYLDFPGVLEFWKSVQVFYEPGVRELVAENTRDA
jgi:hypothetical protein